MAELKQAVEAADKVAAKSEKVAEDIFQLYANLLSVNARYGWNKIVRDQTNADPFTDLQGLTKKDPGDFCASHLMTVWWSTSSPHSPTVRLNRSCTTSQMCSRNPSASAFVSLCSVWSRSTPTSCKCPAGTTAQAQAWRQPQFPWTCPLPRLIWRVTFSKCAHTRGRISSTFPKKVWLPAWTCVHFSHVSRLLSAHVARKDSTIILTRTLCTARERVQSNLVMVLWPEFLRKLASRNIAIFARSMGVHIQCTIPEIVVGLRKVEWNKSNFCNAKKGRKKPNSTTQSFTQLSKKLDQLEKAIKKTGTKKKKHCHRNSDSDSEYGIKFGSIGEVVINLGETCKKTKFTPPSLIKATTKAVTSKGNDLCLTSVSNDDDVIVMSSTQNKDIQVNYSTPTNKPHLSVKPQQ